MICSVGFLFYVFGCIRGREKLGGLEGRGNTMIKMYCMKILTIKSVINKVHEHM